MQAYNMGMAFLRKQAGDNIYLLLSIAPMFPTHYAHGRRISCDAWGSIDNTKYVMNNSSYGWWLNQVYFANDPDHLVMKTLDGNGKESEGVNRARITSGVITGSFIMGDNFSDRVLIKRKGSRPAYQRGNQRDTPHLPSFSPGRGKRLFQPKRRKLDDL